MQNIEETITALQAHIKDLEEHYHVMNQWRDKLTGDHSVEEITNATVDYIDEKPAIASQYEKLDEVCELFFDMITQIREAEFDCELACRNFTQSEYEKVEEGEQQFDPNTEEEVEIESDDSIIKTVNTSVNC